MADEAKIKITLEGLEEAKAKAAAARESKAAAGDQSEANRIAASLLGREYTPGVDFLKQLRALNKQEKVAKDQQRFSGVQQFTQGGSQNMVFGSLQILASMRGGTGQRQGLGFGAAAQLALNLYSKGSMALKPINMLGDYSGMISNSMGSTGVGGAAALPLEVVGEITRQVRQQVAQFTGATSGASDVTAANVMLGGGLSTKQIARATRRAEIEAAYQAQFEDVFGATMKAREWEASVTGWVAGFERATGLKMPDFKKAMDKLSGLLGGG